MPERNSTRFLCRLICLSVLFLFMSCAPYRILPIEILQPAKIQLDYSKRIALLDRNIHRENSPVVFTEPDTAVSVAKEFVKGINYVFTNMNLDTVFHLKAGDSVAVAEGVFPFAFPADTIQLLCQKYQIDYIISTEIQYYEYQKNTITSKWLIRLYENGQESPLDSVTISKHITEIEYINEKDLHSFLKAIFWDGGMEYAQRIVPSWLQTERRVYRQGKVLGMGDLFLQEDKTEEAIGIWESALQLSPRTAIKARINLAWIYENAGDFEQALAFLQEAEKLANEKRFKNTVTVYLKEYIRLIKQRIDYRDQLDKQMK